ncbi:MAG: polyprenyl synthetase family protein [Sphingobacteriia bacterium]|nr:MAG: polyprenyl synthetase family protein [Sphingobacteriia bacterium]
MHAFSDLVDQFNLQFAPPQFPAAPASLYEPCDYFLSIGGKRIRPILCLMGNELFDVLHPDAWELAKAIEVFHNFTLVHDDIMDAAPLRRNMPTVHTKYNTNVAILSGDVMVIRAYEHLNKIQPTLLPRILRLFNKTAREVCEGQQLDMDFEQKETISLAQYVDMITLKTSVLLAASLEMGAILGGASEGNGKHLYAFGKNLGIAFQIQDDYLDAFGDPKKFGKEPGGDIKQNKKTFLLIHAWETANETQRKELQALLQHNPPDKVEKVLAIYKACKVDDWALTLKNSYLQQALDHLAAVAVVSSRKKPLEELAAYLMQRNV